jgi:hypothetical protein
MHADPRRGVVSSTGETHQVQNLFVCDGSAVPGPLGVNPQMTIMALSERAAQFVERRIEEASKRESTVTAAEIEKAQESSSRIEFAETMSGRMQIVGGEEVDAEFEVRASLDIDTAKPLKELGATYALEGLLRLPGIAQAAPCHGTLVMRPMQRHGTLRYDLSFVADDGRPLELRGSKDVSLLSIARGMTTLHTGVWDGSDKIADGTLRFSLRDLPDWLWTWKLVRN